MRASYFVIILTLALAVPQAFADNSAKGGKLEALLKEAREFFYKNKPDAALKKLEEYLGKVKSGPSKVIKHFYVIETVGRIYLQFKQDPDGAISFFSKVQDDPRLTAAEQDIVKGWIGASKEWKGLGQFAKDVKSSDQLFELGKKYYDQGSAKLKFPNDPAGNGEFAIAATYLVPFIRHYDKDPKISDALYMMGEIRRHSWYDNEYWSENHYLTEAIRRSPHTPLALKAWTALNDDVHFGYSGSGGDHTPTSWKILLKELRATADPASSKKQEAQPEKTLIQ